RQSRALCRVSPEHVAAPVPSTLLRQFWSATIVESSSGGFVMKRLILLGALLAVGSLSLVAAQPPAQPAGPRVVDIEKLKDNLYVLTSSSPTPRETLSGGNVAGFITGQGGRLVD